MDLLPYERSTALWQRAAYLQRRLEQLVATAPAGALDPAAVGEVTQLVLAFRARLARHAVAAGGVATTWVRRPPSTRCSWPRRNRRCSTWWPKGSGRRWPWATMRPSTQWRDEFLYSRAASIYGGSAEIQRNIIARRLLALGDDR